MTIFDTIKYPISIPPTVEELESLPAAVISTWIEKSNFLEKDRIWSHFTLYFVHEWSINSGDKKDSEDALESIRLLKQCIYEYSNE